WLAQSSYTLSRVRAKTASRLVGPRRLRTTNQRQSRSIPAPPPPAREGVFRALAPTALACSFLLLLRRQLLPIRCLAPVVPGVEKRPLALKVADLAGGLPRLE